jgi:glutaredoxin
MTSPTVAPRVTVYTRVGCHLCDRALEVVGATCDALSVSWQETDVDLDPQDRAEYGDLVPVVLVDGVPIGYYEISEQRLKDVLVA